MPKKSKSANGNGEASEPPAGVRQVKNVAVEVSDLRVRVSVLEAQLAERPSIADVTNKVHNTILKYLAGSITLIAAVGWFNRTNQHGIIDNQFTKLKQEMEGEMDENMRVVRDAKDRVDNEISSFSQRLSDLSSEVKDELLGVTRAVEGLSDDSRMRNEIVMNAVPELQKELVAKLEPPNGEIYQTSTLNVQTGATARILVDFEPPEGLLFKAGRKVVDDAAFELVPQIGETFYTDRVEGEFSELKLGILKTLYRLLSREDSSTWESVSSAAELREVVERAENNSITILVEGVAAWVWAPRELYSDKPIKKYSVKWELVRVDGYFETSFQALDHGQFNDHNYFARNLEEFYEQLYSAIRIERADFFERFLRNEVVVPDEIRN